MESAVLNTVSIDIENSGYILKCGGQVLKFDGFMAIYDHYDDIADDENQNMTILPNVKKGDVLEAAKIEKKQHFTEPPARYTEASLIKFLEENGIGRPSTYAPIISIIISRDYVRREGKTLVGTELGEITTEFMKKHFPKIVDYEFTAEMEEKLDDIENSKTTIEGVIGDFYLDFAKELEKIEKEGVKRKEKKTPAEESDYDCPKCGKNCWCKHNLY